MPCCTRTTHFSLCFLAIIAGVFAAVMLHHRSVKEYAHSGKNAPVLQDLQFPVPEFRLAERNGGVVRNSDLIGKVWVASFIFTRCTGSCPAVTATMAALQQSTANDADFRLISFTVDPDRDSPDELKKYADRYGADPNRWLFLTGPEADIHCLAQEGFKFATGRNREREPGQEEFLHTSKIALVDKKGMIRHIFDGLFVGADAEKNRTETIDRMKQAIAVLNAE